MQCGQMKSARRRWCARRFRRRRRTSGERGCSAPLAGYHTSFAGSRRLRRCDRPGGRRAELFEVIPRRTASSSAGGGAGRNNDSRPLLDGRRRSFKAIMTPVPFFRQSHAPGVRAAVRTRGRGATARQDYFVAFGFSFTCSYLLSTAASPKNARCSAPVAGEAD